MSFLFSHLRGLSISGRHQLFPLLGSPQLACPQVLWILCLQPSPHFSILATTLWLKIIIKKKSSGLLPVDLHLISLGYWVMVSNLMSITALMAPHSALCIDPQLGAEKKEIFSCYSGISLASLTTTTVTMYLLPYNVTVRIRSYLL